MELSRNRNLFHPQFRSTQPYFRVTCLQILDMNSALHGAKYAANVAVPLNNEERVSRSKLLLSRISENHDLGVFTM